MKIAGITADRWRLSLLLIFYYFALDFAYFELWKIYAYFGFEYVYLPDQALLTYFLIPTLTISLLLSKHLSTFCWTLGFFLLTFLVFPTLTYYCYNSDADIRQVIGMLTLFYGYILSVNLVPNVRIRKLPKKWIPVIFVTLITIMIIPFLIARGIPTNFKVFLLEDIYEQRFAARDSSNIFTAYFEGWLSRTIAPLLLIFGLIEKKKFLVWVALICLCYLYMTSAHKSVFLATFQLYIFYRLNSYEKIATYVTLLLMSLWFVMMFLPDTSAVKILITAITSYRTLFVPVEVASHYYEFFSDIPLYWRQSPFNIFVDYPYDTDPAHLMGREYFGNVEMSANTGIAGEGFMNMGWAGTVINTLIFSTIIGLINNSKIDKRYFGAVFIYIPMIQNGGMLTIILTHGFFLLVLLPMFLHLENRTY